MRARQGQDPGATSWYALIWNYTLQKYKNTQYKIKEYKSTTVQKYKNTKVLHTKTQVDMRPFKTRHRSAVRWTVLDREMHMICRVEVVSAGRQQLISVDGSPGFSPNLAFHPNTRILSCPTCQAISPVLQLQGLKWTFAQDKLPFFFTG